MAGSFKLSIKIPSDKNRLLLEKVIYSFGFNLFQLPQFDLDLGCTKEACRRGIEKTV